MLHVERRPVAATPVLRLLCGVILAAAVAGCAGTPKKSGFPWWPQGSGNASGEELRTAEAEPSNAGQASAPSAENSAADRRTPAQAPPPAGEQSRAVTRAEAVRYGDLLFVSGQIADYPASLAIEGSDIQDQMRIAMDNVKRILESHSLTMDNILSVTVYMQDIDELPKVEAAYATYFRRSLPARSVVRVDGLPGGSLVEISVIAGK